MKSKLVELVSLLESESHGISPYTMDFARSLLAEEQAVSVKEQGEAGLRECPFCGAKGKVVHSEFYDAPDCGGERHPELDDFHIACTSCNFARTYGFGNMCFPTEELAKKAWNMRPTPAPVASGLSILGIIDAYMEPNEELWAKKLVQIDATLAKYRHPTPPQDEKVDGGLREKFLSNISDCLKRYQPNPYEGKVWNLWSEIVAICCQYADDTCYHPTPPQAEKVCGLVEELKDRINHMGKFYRDMKVSGGDVNISNGYLLCLKDFDLCLEKYKHESIKVEEPLAVLADRKGLEIGFCRKVKDKKGLWCLGLSDIGDMEDSRGYFYGSDFAECEAKARKFLESLPSPVKGNQQDDKREGV